MFDLKKDLNIYKSDVHAEWKKVFAGLKSDGQNYIIPYRLKLKKGYSLEALSDHSTWVSRPSSVSLPLATFILDLKLSSEAKDVTPLKLSLGDYTLASQIRGLIAENPNLKTQGTVIKLVPIASVNVWLEDLSPESVMQNTITSIRHICRYKRHGGRMGKLRSQVLLYALYGMYLPLQITDKARSLVLDNIQTGDFGFRDVAHVLRLEDIVTGDDFVTAVTAEDFANVINEIDALLASYGRPVKRPSPSSLRLREICRLVKTSPLPKTSQSRKQ